MSTEQQAAEPFAGWCDLQIMGHVHHLGHVSEVDLFGAKFLKVEPINPRDGTAAPTIYYRPESVYSLEPATEEEIRESIDKSRQYALRRQRLLAPAVAVEEEASDEDDDPPPDEYEDEGDTAGPGLQ